MSPSTGYNRIGYNLFCPKITFVLGWFTVQFSMFEMILPLGKSSYFQPHDSMLKSFR